MVQTGKDQKSRLDIGSLEGKFDWHFFARTVEFFLPDPESFEEVDIRNRVSAGPIAFDSQKGKERTRASLDSQELTLNGKLKNDLVWDGNFQLNNLVAPSYLLKPVVVEQKITGKLTRDFKSLTGETRGFINGLTLFTSAYDGKAIGGISLQGKLSLFPDPGLAKIVKLSLPVKRLLASSAPVQASFNLNRTAEKMDFAASLEEKTAQYAGTHLHGLLLSFAGQTQKGGTNIKADARIAEMEIEPLKKKWIVGLATTANWDDEKKQLAAEGAMRVQGEEAARFTWLSSHQPESFLVDSTLNTKIGKYLEGILTASQLKDYGGWDAVTKFQAKGTYPRSATETFARGGDLSSEGATTLHQTRLDKARPKWIVGEPISLRHKIELSHGKLLVELKGEAPFLELADVGKVRETRLDASLRSPNVAQPDDFDLLLEMNQGEVSVAQKGSGHAPPLAGLIAKVKATIRNGDKFVLEHCSAEFNHKMVNFTAEATGKLKRQDFQARGQFDVSLPKDFPKVADQRLGGRVEFPWTISILRGKEISFEGIVGLDHLNWETDEESVRGISGRIPVSEKLVLDGAKIKFASLITQNPFERVDYERLRPLIRGAEQVRIDSIRFEDKTYGPFVGFFSMKQNMISAHQFDMNLGKSGLAYGEMYFDVYPANLQVGFLSRLTNLNLVEVLPKRFLSNLPKGDKNLSGRSGIVINLNKGSVDGRIDITEIGASQLLTLINVLDPKYEDDKMNMTRSALGVGYPSFVEMSFQQGYMDMGVDLVLLGVSQRYNVRGIPISTLVSSATADMVKKAQEGPLK